MQFIEDKGGHIHTCAYTVPEGAAEMIRAGIEANRHEAGDLVSRVLEGDPDAGERMNQLNEAWYALGSALHRLTGEDPAPYLMGR